MSSEVPLQLNDPVSIESSTLSGQQLHGIVAYLGDVEFSEQAQDFVGIRLTGASVGLGKNDGVVNGKSYFEAGPNGGMFVRYSSGKISKRALTRLQELQLKRELGVRSTTKTSSISVSSTISDARASASQAPPLSVDASAAKGNSPSAAAKSRLDEIRKRREAAMARSTKSSEDDASVTSIVSNSSALTSPKLGVAKTRTANNSTKDKADAESRSNELRAERDASRLSPSVSKLDELRIEREQSGLSPTSSRLNELRVEREASRLSRNLGKTPTPKASIFFPSPLPPASSSQRMKHDASSEKKLEDLTNILQERETEISHLKSALEESKQLCDQTSSELQRALDSAKQVQELKPTTSLESSSISAETIEVPNNLEDNRYDCLEAEKHDLQNQLNDALATVQSFQRVVSEGNENHTIEVSALNQELAVAKSRALVAERESHIVKEQFDKKSSNASDFLKERAKLTGEISTLRRRVSDLQSAVSEYESSVEELAIDKEALLEEKEELVDQLEDKTLEIASLQIELEEVKLDLEESKIALEEANERRTATVVTTVAGAAGDGGGAQETSKALSSQNDRLREALIRLREQTNIEKMELTKQLRLAEKDAATGRELVAEVESLRKLKVKHTSEIHDLKEIVDTQNVYEQMVEDLSDKVTRLEDEAIELQSAIRDLEEAAEISQEMEEVQAELNKTLRLDVDKRDTAIRNFEEAIKIQRRREDDLQRAIGNYRSAVESLKDEKAALLAAHDGGEGEKSNLLVMSQRALAHASQLASDQASFRKREAAALFDRINAQVASQFSIRIEGLLPGENFVAAEVASMKGELLMGKITGYASAILSALEENFRKSIVSPIQVFCSQDDRFRSNDQWRFQLSEEALQQVEIMIHQGKFSRAIIDASANCMLWLCVGQWPHVLTPDESRALGSAVATGPASSVEHLLCQQLRILKEEGCLPSHHGASFLTDLEDRIGAMKTFLVEGGFALSPEWQNKPSWVIIKETTSAKYLLLAVMAALSSALSPSDENISSKSPDAEVSGLLSLRRMVDRIVNEIERTTRRLVSLPFDVESSLLITIAAACKMCSDEAYALLESIHHLFSKEVANVDVVSDVRASAERVLDRLETLSSSLNGATFTEAPFTKCHPISPESDNPWDGLMLLASKSSDAIYKDGHSVLTLFQIRAHDVERKLSNAISSEQRLAITELKVASLEKVIVARSQELAMQTSRMAELEKILAESHLKSQTTTFLSTTVKCAEAELARLRDENQMLTEAVDVLHAQVDDYESEIRALKEVGGKMHNRRAMFSPSKSGVGDHELYTSFISAIDQEGSESGTKPQLPVVASTTIKLEAAIFRPALKMLCAEVAMWKGKAIENKLASLPPLSFPNFSLIPSMLQPQDGEDHLSMNPSHLLQCKEELILATAQIRLAKATISVVDVCKFKNLSVGASKVHTIPSRRQLRDQREKDEFAMQRLENAGFAARSYLSKLSGTSNLAGAW